MASYFGKYNSTLDYMYKKGDLDEKSPDYIRDYFNRDKQFMQNDFRSLFYMDSDKKIYHLNGIGFDFPDTSFADEKEFTSSDFYVSNIFKSPFDGSYIFVVSKNVHDAHGKFVCALGASVSVSNLQKFWGKIKFSETSFFCLNDRNGKFILHPDKRFIGKLFPLKVKSGAEYPLREADLKNDSKTITSWEDMNTFSSSSMIEIKTVNGEAAYLFYRKIKNCRWVLSVVAPKVHVEKIYKEHFSTWLAIFLIAVVVIFILFFVEKRILDSFYKKHLVELPYDPLTNLFTRQHFEKQVSQILKHNPKNKYMLVTTDIRGFKFINQNYGEETGDKLIVYYSKKLALFASRLHGLLAHGYADRFAAFFKVTCVANAMSELEKYLKEIDEDIKNYEIPFFPKFGITFYHGERRRLVSVKELVGQAVYAKSTIKNNHLVQFAVYEPRFLNLINNERIMEANMERALNEEEFIVLYQPKVSLADDRVVGAEALVRWNSKELGFVTPNNFIPLFEKNGFIKKLDFYVYEKVFKFIKKQLDEGKPVVPVSVNMSRNHNKPDKFMHDFMKIFNKYSIPPEYIQVEIVERSFMDMQTLCDITELLHKNGFSVAMDDFGSGESSLSMLTKIPVDVLKFDSQFLISFQKEYIDKNDKAATVLEILINLSKKLEKQTVFEGVETEAQRDFLRLISCDQVQGYFYSKPLFEEDFVNFLARNS